MDWLKNMFSDHTFLFFFAVIGIPMIVISLKEIVKLLIKHRERMAMIEHGLDPDAYRQPRPIERASDETVAVNDLSN
jgi:hypothetical protein